MKKIKKSKRILIFILCLVLICSQSLLVLANGEASDPAVAASSTELVQTDVVDDTEEAVIEETTEVETEETTEAVTEETTEVETEESTEVETEETTEVETEESTEVETEESTEVVTEETTETETGEITEVVPELPVITAYDYKSDEVNVLVTLTNPEDLPDDAELVVTPIVLDGDIEYDINKMASEEGLILKTFHAFDIKFMLDGEEVQPGETVKVTISLPKVELNTDATVYHVDEKDNVEDMEGTVDEKGDMVFETPHFSTYVVLETIDGELSNGSRTVYSASGIDADIKVDKTAKVDNWDERTYDITITAEASLKETSTTRKYSDGMLILDMSGSMIKLMDPDYQTYANAESKIKRLGKYNAIYNTGVLDQETYYYVNSSSSMTYMTDNQLAGGHDTTSRIMAYFDHDGTTLDGWYYYDMQYRYTIPKAGTTYDSSKWTRMPDDSSWYVYEFDTARINNLKKSVISYMESVAEVSPASRLGMIAFYESAYKVLDFATIADGNELALDVRQRVAALRPQREWCTYPDTALQMAFNEMVGSTTYTKAKINTSTGAVTTPGVVKVTSYNQDYLDNQDVPKYIILFSDGQPDGTTGGSSSTDKKEKWQITADTIAWGQALKDAGIKIHTVAFAYFDEEYTWLQEISSGDDYIHEADDLTELAEVLAKIEKTETIEIEEVPVDVKDYIDPRFVILDNDGNPIGVDYPGIADGITVTTTGYDGDTAVTRTGKVYYDENDQQYIIWEDQMAKKAGSSWTVKVQAQDDYIGGNDVTTNIDSLSVIDAGDYGTFDLPDPVVNVKATMEIGNNNLYIYKGTTAPIEYSEATDPLTMYKAVQDDIARYLAPGYAGVDAADFTVKWYTDASCTTEIPMDEIDDDYLQNEENYYLKFTYDPGDASEESNSNTTKDDITYISGRDDGSDNGIVEAVNTADSSKQYGIYNIKLWQIIKRSSSSANLPLEGIEFEIVENTTGLTYYGKSDANGFVALFTDSECTVPAVNTLIGTYTLSETKTVEGYTLSGETWTINAAYENEPDVSDVTSSTGEAVITETPSGVVISYIYVNDPYVYELPSTGSIGIYGYLIFGVALIMSGTMIIYKRRRMEVLRRR